LKNVLVSTEEAWKVTAFTKLQLETTSWEAFALLRSYIPFVGILFYRLFGTAYRPHLQALRNFPCTGTEGLSRNDIPATADCERIGGLFATDIETSRERRSISPTLEDESVTNAVFSTMVAFAYCSTL
jgi:hypothetical protein